jgi:hypothetical protein
VPVATPVGEEKKKGRRGKGKRKEREKERKYFKNKLSIF